MTPDRIEALFTSGGSFRFARWSGPMAPVAFGVDDATVATLRAGLSAVGTLIGRPLADADPELGANLMLFFCQDWDELREVPDLGRLVEGLEEILTRLKASEATQYRVFRFNAQGGIRACFVFLRMAGAMAYQPADELALTQAVQAALLWGEEAFAGRSPLGLLPDGRAVLRPEVAAVLASAYDPVLPDASEDAALALRLAARLPAE
nr:hypothetical protein [Pseudoroseicyclus aestuarii]